MHEALKLNIFERSISSTSSLTRACVDVDAFGVTGHAHYLGKSMRMVAELPDGSQKLLLNIPEWDFAWQEEYRFEESVRLPAGTKLKSKVVWDNSEDNPFNPSFPPELVRWGLESKDEMGRE